MAGGRDRHPELTGRESVFLNGGILGMTRREIDDRMDEIIKFSGLEEVFYTPEKFYSCGMGVRLGVVVARIKYEQRFFS